MLEEAGRNREGSAQKKLLISDQMLQEEKKEKEIPQLEISFGESPDESLKKEEGISSEHLVDEEMIREIFV